MDDNKIQVWYLISSLNVGGAQRTLVDLVNDIDHEKFEPVIWTLLDPGTLATDVNDDVPIKSLGINHKYEIYKLSRFVRDVRESKPDILQSFLYFDNIIARFVGTVSRHTTVVCGVRSVPNQPSTVRTVLDKLTIFLANEHISNSKAGVEFIINRGANPNSVHIVYNGRDLSEYRDAIAPPGLSQSIGIPQDATTIGTVGRLTKRKGHHDLIDAWPTVVDSHPDCNLVIAGDGPEMDALQTRAKERNVADSVHLIGERDDIPEILDLYDIFVFPSHYEGLPGALLEAMAAKKPIVTTPVDGNSELVSNKKEGRYVEPCNPGDLSRTLLWVLDNQGAADYMAERAQKKAFDQFNKNQMILCYQEIYSVIKKYDQRFTY